MSFEYFYKSQSDKQEMKDYQTAKYDIDRLLNIDEEQEQKKEEKQRSR